MRVGYARRSYKGKVYETPLVITSYRDKNGTPRNKTLANLTSVHPETPDFKQCQRALAG